jgi:hypothetical protein
MISHAERVRLMEAYRREPCVGAAAMVKCVGGLMIVGALAVIGAVTDDSSGNNAGGQQAKSHESAPAALRTTHYEARGHIEPARWIQRAETPSVDTAARR